MTLVLGIETSCDETAAAVVEDGRSVLSSVVSSHPPDASAHGRTRNSPGKLQPGAHADSSMAVQ